MRPRIVLLVAFGAAISLTSFRAQHDADTQVQSASHAP
jgi:hypothetical protein